MKKSTLIYRKQKYQAFFTKYETKVKDVPLILTLKLKLNFQMEHPVFIDIILNLKYLNALY